MFGIFGRFRSNPSKSEELERFKELTSIPGVIDALCNYNLGIRSVDPSIGPEVQECIHLSHAITSRTGISSDRLFENARSGRWDSLEQRLSKYQAVTAQAGLGVDAELEAIIEWANKNNLPELTSSDAGFYKTTGIPRDKKKLMSLRFIHLPSAGIREIPPQLSVLPNVQGICFDDNEIRELPESICSMNTVVMLHLENNHLESLPDAIGNMSSLTLIDLDGNNMSRFPRSLLDLRNLRKLRLSRQKHGNNVALDETSRAVMTRLVMDPSVDVSV